MSKTDDREIIAEWTRGLHVDAATRDEIKQINSGVPRGLRCVSTRPDEGYVAWFTGPEAVNYVQVDVGYPYGDEQWGRGWEAWSRQARGSRQFLCGGWQGDGPRPAGTKDRPWVAVFPTKIEAEVIVDSLVGKAGVYDRGPWAKHVAPVASVRPGGFAGYFLAPRNILLT